jgi:hypothetical protein
MMIEMEPVSSFAVLILCLRTYERTCFGEDAHALIVGRQVEG